jgi:hypothetical protein
MSDCSDTMQVSPISEWTDVRIDVNLSTDVNAKIDIKVRMYKNVLSV